MADAQVGAPPGPEHFYDALAQDYHLLFEDWWSAAEWHGAVIARLLESHGCATPAPVLDCTCGIGTQALSLAALGYQVAGTDISTEAVDRARCEAGKRGLEVDLRAAVVRQLDLAVPGQYAAVISCDNSLPHLTTDEDLLQALRAISSRLRPGGLLVASIRDYDALRRERSSGVPLTLHGEPGRRHGSAQSWRWSTDGELITITLVALREVDGAWTTKALDTTYRALQRSTMTEALSASGFEGIGWLEPEASGYYQPIVMARRPADGAREASP